MMLGLLAFASPALAAAPNWTLNSPRAIVFSCGLGNYSHTLDTVSQDVNGNLTGTGKYDANNAYTWNLIGNISGDNINFTITYTGLSAGSTYNSVGVIAGDGSISGTTDSNCQSFSMLTGSATHLNHGLIVKPEANEIVFGLTDLVAWYHDESPDVDDDGVQWAVRKGTCAAGTNTVAGNVDGHTDVATWDGTDFSFVLDTTGFDPSMYCFIFNPTDDAGQNNVRETREFYVAESYVNGGGHILEVLKEGDKRKDWLDISFGGWVANVGTLMGEWNVVVHNVLNPIFDGGHFVATSFSSLNLYDNDSPTCATATNFTATGTWNGVADYTMTFRAGDSDLPASADPDDTVRITITGPGGFRLETSESQVGSGDFNDESSCVGSARTGLDTGNISIVDNS